MLERRYQNFKNTNNKACDSNMHSSTADSAAHAQYHCPTFGSAERAVARLTMVALLLGPFTYRNPAYYVTTYTPHTPLS